MTQSGSPMAVAFNLRRGVFWILLGVVVILASVLWQPIAQRFYPSEAPQMVWQVKLPENTKYDFLRQADFLGNRFVMLRHHHTAQRIILLTGEPTSGQTFEAMYDQPLSAFHFTVLMKVFQSQSTFHDKSLNVTQAHVAKSGMFQNATFQLPYKTYVLTTTVDGKPADFEAYVAKLMYRGQSRGLVFTFNSKDAVVKAALTDLLGVLQPVQAPPAK